MKSIFRYSFFNLTICLLLSACSKKPEYSFGKSVLKNTSLQTPTSLQFGPDGRLYVSQQNGIIKIFTIKKNAPNDYSVIRTDTVDLVNKITNHNDNGEINEAIKGRQVTGILVKGTSGSPVIYVSSNDSRIGAPGAGDTNLDTNSGIVSMLTWNGKSWSKIDLVRGLPRSEEDHSINGMQLDEKTNTLYLAVGGNTNAGSPSKMMGYTCEYALSASILSIDLNKLDSLPLLGDGDSLYKYDIPTLDDPTRPNVSEGKDVNDPFGGNDGLNQAKVVPDGPVKIYATGFRNPYDIIITSDRKMYTVDNGPNTTFGGYPENEGMSSVTNNYVQGEPGSTIPTNTEDSAYALDGLEFIGDIDTYIPGSFYGGHPNPIRANPFGAGLYTHDGEKGVWRNGSDSLHPLPKDWPPIHTQNVKESDYLMAAKKDKSLVAFWTSTNGITEYKASNFGSKLKGALLVTNFDNGIYKIDLTEDGRGITTKHRTDNYIDEKPTFTEVGIYPLDITAQGDTEIFPGTIWVAAYASSTITILEPEDIVDCSENIAETTGCWKYIKPDFESSLAREENAYAACGENFYLLGGRGIQPVLEFNPIKNKWSKKAPPPIELHHFQAVVLDSLIYVIGAFTGEYPHEKPVTNIYIYNTLSDKWTVGDTLPAARLRGSTGNVVYKGKIYIVNGIIDGHWSGGVNWFDEYDPQTKNWKILPDAPRTRDHFHSVLINDKIYLAGGRNSSAVTDEVFNKTIPEVDIFDFNSGQWQSLPKENNIPTPRAGGAAVKFGQELLVIGGENTEPKASNRVEALNVETNTWRTLSNLKQGRHGTQAIVKDNAVYIATGAGDQGGSNLLNTQEFFYVLPKLSY